MYDLNGIYLPIFKIKSFFTEPVHTKTVYCMCKKSSF